MRHGRDYGWRGKQGFLGSGRARPRPGPAQEATLAEMHRRAGVWTGRGSGRTSATPPSFLRSLTLDSQAHLQPNWVVGYICPCLSTD